MSWGDKMEKNYKIRNVGVADYRVRVFRNLSFTGNGIAYSSYLAETDSGYILFGAVPDRFSEVWMQNIAQVTGYDRILAMVVFDNEGCRKSVSDMLEANPSVTVIAPYAVMFRMKKDLPDGTKCVDIRSGRQLVLGGSSFRFEVIADKMATPALYVLDEDENTVFTADAFGSMYPELEMPEDDRNAADNWYRGMQQFCDDTNVVKRQSGLSKAVEFIRKNNVSMVCPMIGPAVGDQKYGTNTALDAMLAYYVSTWQSTAPAGSVAVICEGTNELMDLAGRVINGLKDAEISNITLYDLSSVDRNQMLRELRDTDVMLFGTSVNRENVSKAMWDVITSLKKEDCEGKMASVFYLMNSFGDNVDLFRSYLKFLGFDLNIQDYFVMGEIGESELKNADNYGFGVGCSIRRVPNPRQPKLVRCLVCGEIFDASLGKCPVCGVGLDQCVPVDEEEILFRKDSDKRYVVLGGGIAGVSAADAIRSRDKTGSIIMLSAEDYRPINRPKLTKDLSMIHEMPDELFIHPMSWYEERNIDLRTGVSATSIDPEGKTVTTDGGDILPYDKLIYATGAECFIPPFKGWDKDGVITIRHLTDSRKLEDLMHNAKNAVVIGGGVLGLEAASELMRAGLHVTVLEATPQIIGRQADSDSAAVLKGIMADMGVECHEGVSIEEIVGDGRAEGVRIGSGEVFPADFVVVSCGNKGNIGVAKDAGVAVERTIVVNQFMETNIPDIYACGDCAQYGGVNFQLWQEASSQGSVAGANAAGERTEYKNQLLGLNLDGFGTTLFAIGDAGKQPRPYHTVRISDDVRKSKETYWFNGHSLEGAVIIGNPDRTTSVTEAVTAHARYEEVF